MKIKKGTVLSVAHQRSGKWIGQAIRDFDTEKEEFYPLALYQDETVSGMSTSWERGDEIPCRGDLCKIKVIED